MASRYWVGGSANWDNTAGTKWALTSGGAGGQAVPGAGDDVFLDAASGASVVTITSTATCNNFDETGFTGNLAGTALLNIAGNAAFVGTVSYTGTVTFNGTATGKTISSTAGAMACAFNVNGVGGGWTASTALNIAGNLTVSNGAWDAGGNTITCATVISSSSNIRTIAGSGTWNLTGTGNVFNINNNVNLTFAMSGTTINVTNAAATSISGSAVSYGNLNVSGPTGAWGMGTGGATWNNVDFTGSTCNWSTFTGNIRGNLKLSAGMTWSALGVLTLNATAAGKTITSNGVTGAVPLVFDGVGGGWTFVDAFTTTGNTTLTNGSIDLNGNAVTCASFLSGNANARTIAFSGGRLVCTANATTVWSCSTATNMTVTGTPRVDLTYAGSVGTRTIAHGNLAGGSEANSMSFNITAGSDIIARSNGGAMRNLDFTGFTGSDNTSNATTYGSVTLGAGMTWSGNNGLFFGASILSPVLRTNGVTVDSLITVSSGSLQLGDALTMAGNRTLSLTAGLLDFNGKPTTCGSLFSTNANVRTLAFGGAAVTVLDGAFSCNFTTATNLTITGQAGASINMSNAGAKTFQSGAPLSGAYPRLVNSGAGVMSVNGAAMTLSDLGCTSLPGTITINSGITLLALTLAGAPGNPVTLNTNISGTRRNLTIAAGTAHVSNVSLQDIGTAGGARFEAQYTDGCLDLGNNLGWYFGNGGISEAGALADSPDAVTNRVGVISELMAGADAEAASLGAAVNTLEAMGAADARAASLGASVSSSDAMAASDARNAVTDRPGARTDALAAADTLSAAMAVRWELVPSRRASKDPRLVNSRWWFAP